MIKYFCDVCGKHVEKASSLFRIQSVSTVKFYLPDFDTKNIYGEICAYCFETLKEWLHCDDHKKMLPVQCSDKEHSVRESTTKEM